ncbi:hypothetical protein G3N57_18785, partial [Paraburkholderia sp. Se-20369]|nr:hypothetical protein [Paraburkholderia sp. Se-20369]
MHDFISHAKHFTEVNRLNHEDTITMNKTYALVWNHAQGSWTAVGETARRCGKSGGRKRLAATAL